MYCESDWHGGSFRAESSARLGRIGLSLARIGGFTDLGSARKVARCKNKLYAAVAAAKQPQGQSPNTRSSLPAPALLKPWEIDWKSAAALLIGNEGAGLPDDLVRTADALVSIPQAVTTTAVGVESLNAAMAATVLLYEAMRQRDIKPKNI